MALLLVSCAAMPREAHIDDDDLFVYLEVRQPENPREIYWPLEEDDDDGASFQAQLDELLWAVQTATNPTDIIYAYFEMKYLSYIYLQEVDLRPVLDMTRFGTYNIERWMANLVQRRRLLWETNLAFVNTERHDFTINFIGEEELNDIRMEHWASFDRDIPEGEEIFHFVITGEPGKAYPPLMAVNAQHTIRLVPNEEGGWLITLHFFPGSVRKFYRTGPLRYYDDDEVLAAILEEFDSAGIAAVEPRAGSRLYNPIFAADYAKAFAEHNNPAFYRINDWMGNCMNFVSQSILHGFGSGEIPEDSLSRFMTREWFAGSGGGAPAWENVGFFWQYVTSGGALQGQVLDSASALRVGDIVLTRTLYVFHQDDPERFTHSLIVVDSDTLLLAQNTPANFIYYSDLVNTVRRYIRPVAVG